MDIRRMPLADVRARGEELFAAAAAETGSPGVVQWRFIETLDAAGALLVLGVEVGGELVGYCCAAVGPEYWSQLTTCTTLSMFVRRPHRGRAGKPLLRQLMAEAFTMGADAVRVMAIPGSRLERLCRLLGLVPQAIALEGRDLQYTAGHARDHRHHLHRRPGLHGLLGRAPSRGGQAGPVPAAPGAGQG